MYVCMYVCMCVCRFMYACMYLCMYVRMYVCMYVCMYNVCMYVCMYVQYIPMCWGHSMFYDYSIQCFLYIQFLVFVIDVFYNFQYWLIHKHGSEEKNCIYQMHTSPGAYCIKLLPEKNFAFLLSSFFLSKVNCKIMLTGVFIFYQSFFSQEKVLGNKHLVTLNDICLYRNCEYPFGSNFRSKRILQYFANTKWMILKESD